MRRLPNSDKFGRKALLLRVGIDRGTGGVLGPIFPDGSFEYIPIPETVPTRCAPTYATTPGRHVRSLADLLPARLAPRVAHIDPDFVTATYGDAAPRQRQQLLRLGPGDLLVFYTGLLPRPPADRPKLFVIGHFEVRRVHDLSACDLDRPSLRRRVGHTAHFLRRPRDRRLALVEGERSQSKLFAEAVPFGDGRDCLFRDLASFGYQGSILRAVGHWIVAATGVSAVEAWLRRGPASLVAPDTRMVAVGSTLRPVEEIGDVAVDDQRPREGDWIIALGQSDSRQVRILARVNRVARERGCSRAFSSIYWCFSHGGPALDIAAFQVLMRDRMILDASMIRRVVSQFYHHYRIGSHQEA